MKMRMNVTGRVQGVGFRYTTHQIANEIGLTGTVKNEADGSVSIQAVGSQTQIANFIDQLKNPKNPFSKVEHIQQTIDDTLPDFKTFDVIY
ncbi:acylphosphatase [Enterococcus sp. ALS3]|uniref:acylphosphatase n=1 Tax=Enterococcus alishanensis TaxID=1303817 RepID=A0ABS6T8I4_9ENTE|nr:acylphosphatase [Enterococcus alishanensis]MBV7389205.1 acylphosphatase [Enterococcus alishanensis]